MGIAAIAGAIAEPSTLKNIFGFVPILIGPPGGELVIDVLESESPEYGFEITSDPVECGMEIQDSIFEKPTTLTLDCVFTDFQFSAKIIAASLVNGLPLLGTWRDKKDALYKMKDSKVRVDISTPLNLYKNHLIESISPNVTATSGDCFRCRIVTRSVKVVSSLIGYIDPAELPIELQGVNAASGASNKTQGTSDKGAAQTTESSNSATTKNAEQSGYANWE